MSIGFAATLKSPQTIIGLRFAGGMYDGCFSFIGHPS
jgi:hypothetical protein